MNTKSFKTKNHKLISFDNFVIKFKIIEKFNWIILKLFAKLSKTIEYKSIYLIIIYLVNNICIHKFLLFLHIIIKFEFNLY